MDIQEIIKTRRNVAKFKAEPVTSEQLTTWLGISTYAPNHRRNEPWEVLLIGPETRAKLNHKTDFNGAPVVLGFLSIPGKTPFERDENITAVASFIQNFSLIAHAEGAGTRWFSFGASDSSRQIMGVPEGYDVVGLLAVGYPEEFPEAKPRTPIAEKMKLLP